MYQIYLEILTQDPDQEQPQKTVSLRAEITQEMVDDTADLQDLVNYMSTQCAHHVIQAMKQLGCDVPPGPHDLKH